MKAIWYILDQVNWEDDAGNDDDDDDDLSSNPAPIPNRQEKLEWKIGFRNKLDDLLLREQAKALLPSEKRNIVYQVRPPYVCVLC
jgi:hypothetical protein